MGTFFLAMGVFLIIIGVIFSIPNPRLHICDAIKNTEMIEERITDGRRKKEILFFSK